MKTDHVDPALCAGFESHTFLEYSLGRQKLCMFEHGETKVGVLRHPENEAVT